MTKNPPELFSQDLASQKKPRVLTVSQITQDIKLILENTYGEVWVEGEISNFKVASSGHYYFTLKDAQAVLAAVMFSRSQRGLAFKLADGLKVICFGKIDVYPPRGQYQLIVEKIEPKGLGAQQLAFQQLKEKLFKEGLFAPSHKKPLPLIPFRVGIVTSSAGAAVRDILQILKKGAPGIDVVIRSVRVQGEGASQEIALAVEEFNQYEEIDLLIISRGGGSVEDLWAFNEEIVARAIYQSHIPTVSAVGHQINVTLADLVADCFVETPSAAAKIIVDKKNALLAQLDTYRYKLNSAVTDTIHALSNNLVALKHMLKSPLDRLLEKAQMVDELSSGLDRQMRQNLDLARQKTTTLIERLKALSPLAILLRGYSLSTLLPQEKVIRDAEELKPQDRVKTVLGRGAFISKVEEVIND